MNKKLQKRFKVIVVDDNKEFLYNYKNEFLDEVFRFNLKIDFEFFDDPNRALKRCIENSYDLLITSINFENYEIDGFKLAKIANVSGKPVIFISKDSFFKRLKYILMYFDLIKKTTWIKKPSSTFLIFKEIKKSLKNKKEDLDSIFKHLLAKV